MKRFIIAALLACAMVTSAAAVEADRRISIVMELIQKRSEMPPVLKVCVNNELDESGECAGDFVTIATHRGAPTITLHNRGYVFDTHGVAHPVTYIFRDVGITGTLSSATVFHHGPIVRDPLFPALRQELYEHALDAALDFLLEELTKKR